MKIIITGATRVSSRKMYHSFHIGPSSMYHPNVLKDCTACQAPAGRLGNSRVLTRGGSQQT